MNRQRPKQAEPDEEWRRGFRDPRATEYLRLHAELAELVSRGLRHSDRAYEIREALIFLED